MRTRKGRRRALDPTSSPPAEINQPAPTSSDDIDQMIARASARHMEHLRALSSQSAEPAAPALKPPQQQVDIAEHASHARQEPAYTAGEISVSPVRGAPPTVQLEIPGLGSFSHRVLVVVVFVVIALLVLTLVLVRMPAGRGRNETRPTDSSLTTPAALLASASAATPITGVPGSPPASAPAAIVIPTASGATALALPAATALSGDSATAMLQRVGDTVAKLRTGRLEAVVDYGSGARSSARVGFDLGSPQHAPRFQILTTYESAAGRQSSEQITIGDTSWRRRPDGGWDTVAEQEGAWGQVQHFLPHTDSVELVKGDDTQEGVLHWYDASRDADVALRVDPGTGVPLELRQTTRTTKTLLVVTYTGWNTEVVILPPTAT